MGVGLISVYLLIAVVTLIIYFVKKNYSYWKDRGVTYEEPHIFYGNLKGIGTEKHFYQIYREFYNKFKGAQRFVGFFFFFKPALMVLDLDLVQNILIKDFNNFADRGLFVNEKSDPLSAHLFALDGQQWRSLRHKLSSTFTSGKMKFMFPIVVDVANRFNKVFGEFYEKDNVVEIKELNARYTTDVIGTCAFGLECNSLNDPNAIFRQMTGKFFTEKRHHPLVEGFIMSFPKAAEKLDMAFTPQDISDFFMKAVQDTVDYREKNNIKRNDFMSMLIELKNQSTKDEQGNEVPALSIGQLAAQAFVFFIAGFETSSTTMGFCLYELALNPDVQDKVRAEIKAVLGKSGGEMTYEGLAEMKYLDMVIMETLRKYSILQDLTRVAANDYPVPGSTHIIEKGSRILIPADAIHHDPEIYPNPAKFDPERFTPEEIKKRHPCAWLPFGEGPRNCIGLRFGKMQTRIGLVALLKDYKFAKSEKTEVPLKINPKNFLTGTLNGIYLKVEKI